MSSTTASLKSSPERSTTMQDKNLSPFCPTAQSSIRVKELKSPSPLASPIVKTNGVRKKRRIVLKNHNENLVSSRLEDGITTPLKRWNSVSSGRRNLDSGMKLTKSDSITSTGSISSANSRTQRSYGKGSLESSTTSNYSSPDKTILVSRADVLAVQDAGSFRLEYEHISYLCSTITSAVSPDGINHSKSTYSALWELANRMSITRLRKNVMKNADNSAVKALLSIFETVPLLKSKMAIVSSRTKSSRKKAHVVTEDYNEMVMLGLACLLYYLSIEIGCLNMAIVKEYLVAMVRICCHEPWSRKPTLSENLPLQNQTPFKHSPSKDPTSVGRRKRKHKLQSSLLPIHENQSLSPPKTPKSPSTFSYPSSIPDSTDTQPMTSPSTPAKIISSPVTEQDIPSQTIQSIFQQSSLQHILFAQECCGANCPYQKHKSVNCVLDLEKASGTLALIALKNILSFNSEDTEQDNPVVCINNALFQSNALSLLATIMIDTISTILDLLNTHCTCNSCFQLLYYRLNTIHSILDETCCLVQPNTQSILSSNEIALVPTLLKLVVTCFSQLSKNTILSDLIVVALQTLVSLTHENTVAVHQFINHNENHGGQGRGAKLIFEILYYYHEEITTDEDTKTSSYKTYDTIVYCLNILTNVMEVMISSSSVDSTISFQEQIIGLRLQNHPSAILWLSSWLVSLTSTYQNFIIQGSFGKTPDNSQDETFCTNEEERELTKKEKESLVITGNGFIFLVWFMKQPHFVSEQIFSTMPIPGKLFMRNTLKAFLNFYHYSIGELSFAVVAPVRKLILDLENI